MNGLFIAFLTNSSLVTWGKKVISCHRETLCVNAMRVRHLIHYFFSTNVEGIGISIRKNIGIRLSVINVGTTFGLVTQGMAVF